MAKLIIVPTPIGNLADITIRSLDVLRNAKLILAEDTRTASVLLKHYEISKPMWSYHKFNEHQQSKSLIDKIEELGEMVLISDAGTPGISDPGFVLVRECLANGIEVECLPGATAFVPALVSSGLSCDKFVFEGFLPQKKGRQKRLEFLSTETRTIVFYESPYRVLKTLTQLAEYFGENCPAVAARELTKMHEEIVRGTIKSLIKHFSENTIKGEFVLLISKN